VQSIVKALDREIEIILIDDQLLPAKNFYDLIDKKGSTAEPVDVPSGEVLYQYSSGSTGRPKRVSRTQENLYHEVENFASTAQVNEQDKIFCVVPLYHAHGLGNCLLASTCNGATLVLSEDLSNGSSATEVPLIFKCPKYIETMQAEEITILPAVPYIFNALAESPVKKDVDLSSIRLCFSAGNFLDKSIYDKFFQKFNIPIRQLYGCTEAGGIAINLDDDIEDTLSSVGKPLNNVEISIIDDHGKSFPTVFLGRF
jgi:long-chain acyl-CoA synthetase